MNSEMPSCAVSTCTSTYHNAKKSKNGISFFKFPSDSTLASKWKTRCGLTNKRYHRICSLHFADDDFEEDKINKMLELPLRKYLKKGSVPHLNLPPGCSSINAQLRLIRTKQIQKREETKLHNSIVNDLDVVTSGYSIPSPLLARNVVSNSGFVASSTQPTFSNTFQVDNNTFGNVFNSIQKYQPEEGEMVLNDRVHTQAPSHVQGFTIKEEDTQDELVDKPAIDSNLSTDLVKDETDFGSCITTMVEVKLEEENCDYPSVLTHPEIKTEDVQIGKDVVFPLLPEVKCEDVHIDEDPFENLEGANPFISNYGMKSDNRESLDLYETDPVEGDEESSFSQCDNCLLWFIEAKFVKGHKCPGLKSEYFTCGHCATYYMNELTLKCHLDEHKICCNSCGKRFTHIAHLKNHLLVHSSVKTFTCNQCNKSFKLQISLKRHFAKYHGDKPYTCEQCKQSFIHVNYLNAHIIKVHATQKNFFCHFCDQTFKNSSILSKHLFFHSEKELTCELCDQIFPKKSELDEHMSIHFQ